MKFKIRDLDEARKMDKIFKAMTIECTGFDQLQNKFGISLSECQYFCEKICKYTELEDSTICKTITNGGHYTFRDIGGAKHFIADGGFESFYIEQQKQTRKSKRKDNIDNFLKYLQLTKLLIYFGFIIIGYIFNLFLPISKIIGFFKSLLSG